MPRLVIDNVEIVYQVHSPSKQQASPVLLLHGLGSRSEDWVMQVEALTEAGYQVWTPDLRGLGESSSLNGWPTIEQLGRDMIALLEQEIRRPAHVVGLSLGGTVALALAAERQDLVRSLTLVNTFAHLPLRAVHMRNAVGRAFNLFVGSMGRLGEWVARDLFPRPDQQGLRSAAAQRIAANRRSSYLRLLVAVARFDLQRELGGIDLPALVIAGEQDILVPLSLKRTLVEGMPKARLALFEGSGHATPIDASEAFNDQLMGFLREVDAGDDQVGGLS